MEVFMDDITIYGGTFEECLVNLEAVLNRCIEKDLVRNWDKFHFWSNSWSSNYTYYMSFRSSGS